MRIRCEGKRWVAHESVFSPTCPACRSEASEETYYARQEAYKTPGLTHLVEPYLKKTELPPCAGHQANEGDSEL